jgi:hypothetical protein
LQDTGIDFCLISVGGFICCCRLDRHVLCFIYLVENNMTSAEETRIDISTSPPAYADLHSPPPPYSEVVTEKIEQRAPVGEARREQRPSLRPLAEVWEREHCVTFTLRNNCVLCLFVLGSLVFFMIGALAAVYFAYLIFYIIF